MEKGLIIWRYLSANGTDEIVVLEGKVNASVYLKLIEEYAMPEGSRLIGEHFVYQQDNSPIHTAIKSCRITFGEKYINFEVATFKAQPSLQSIRLGLC